VAANNPFANRGMLLLVIGLIGFGILALILRTPKEVPTSILPTTQAGKPPAPVEPFRKTPSAPGSPKSEEPTKPRATGSHG
jgi:cell division protein FtsN